MGRKSDLFFTPLFIYKGVKIKKEKIHHPFTFPPQQGRDGLVFIYLLPLL